MKRIAASTMTCVFLLILFSGYLVSCGTGSGKPSNDAVNKRTSNAAIAARQLLSAQTSTAEYIVTDLGTLGDRKSSFAYGINDNGQVVGGAYTTGHGRAFLYSNGSLTDLGNLGEDWSAAYGINNNGQVVGWANISISHHHAFLYSNGSMTDLGTLGGDESGAFSINNNGQVVGFADTSTNDVHAFLYSNGSMTDLGTLGGDTSIAYGINNGGQAVGWSYTTIGQAHAFLYSNGSMTDLGTLGGRESVAVAISSSGQVVGSAHTSTNSLHAFLYSNGSMTDLGTLDGNESSAYGINNKGQVVGHAYSSANGDRAVLYSNGHMVDLNDLIPLDSGLVLVEARGINDHGLIAGYGRINGAERAFLLQPVNFTGVGTDVTVMPKDTTTGTRPVAVTFATVTAPGTTTLTTSEQGPPPDAGFKLGNPPVYYDISTTAMYTPPVTICIDYSGISFGNENSLSLRHYEDTDGDGTADKWVDRTISNDAVNKIICAEVNSLSLFTIQEPAWQFTGFFKPIDNLPAVNVVNAGQAIPVKWQVAKADGTPISDTSSFSRLVSYEVDCGDLTVDAGSAVVESAAGRSGLQYQGDGYWQFNWKTPKSYDDQCRSLVLILGDGSSHEAIFTFK